jgi:esterase
VPAKPRQGAAKPVRRIFRSSGLRLNYIDWGVRRSSSQARQLVLIHDLGDSPRTWDLLVPRVRDDFHVFAPELRGHGDSDRPPGAEYAFEHLYADLLAFATEANLQDAIVVGHGAGARLAGRLAAERPTAVSALVLYELESTSGHTETGWSSFDEVVGYLKRQRPGAAEVALDRQGRSLTGGGMDGGRSFKHDTVAHGIYMAGADALWQQWDRIAAPTLVLRGRQSEDLTHAYAVHITEQLALHRLAEIEDSDHWLHHEFPEAFEGTLRWFLDELPG